MIDAPSARETYDHAPLSSSSTSLKSAGGGQGEFVVYFRADCPHSISLLEVICLYQQEFSRLAFELKEVLTTMDAEELLNCGATGTPTVFHRPTKSVFEGDHAFELFQQKRENMMMDFHRRGDAPAYQIEGRLDSRFKPPGTGSSLHHDQDADADAKSLLKMEPSNDHVKLDSLDESEVISDLFDGDVIQNSS